VLEGRTIWGIGEFIAVVVDGGRQAQERAVASVAAEPDWFRTEGDAQEHPSVAPL